MDDANESQNRQKVLQYWSHVFNAGSALFANPGAQVEMLKAFVNTVLSTKLLPEIECLAEDTLDPEFPFPMTAWLLENILNVTVTCNDSETENFLIESHIKLLEATYERSVCTYLKLINIHIALIDRLCYTSVMKRIWIFNSVKHDIVNAVITPMPFTIHSEQHRICTIKILLKVIHGIIDDFLYCCSLQHSLAANSPYNYLLKKLLTLMSMENFEITSLVLPILKALVCDKILIKLANLEVLNAIFMSLPSLLTTRNSSILDIKDDYIFIWRLFRSRVKLSDGFAKAVTRKLLDAKPNCCFEQFIPSEIGFFLAYLLPQNDVGPLLQECQNWSLHDKVLLLKDTVTSELTANLNLNLGLRNMSAKDCSSSWKEILQLILESESCSSKASFGRIKTLSTVLCVVKDVLAEFEQTSRKMGMDIILSFFDGIFVKLLRSVVSHLSESDREETSKLAADCFAALMNLPEAAHLDEVVVKDPLNSVVELITSGARAVDIFVAQTNVPRAKLLEGLQNMPAGLSPSTCIAIFGSAITSLRTDPASAHCAIRAAPFLCLSAKASPSRIIAEILMQAMLSEIEDYQLAVIDAAATTACIASGAARVSRSGECNIITCETCASNVHPKIYGNCSQIEEHLMKLLEPALTSPAVSVRRKLLSRLPTICRHVGPMHGIFFNKILSLTSDPDIEVRMDLANVMPTLLFGQQRVDCVTEGRLADLSPAADRSGEISIFFSKIESEITALLPELWGESLHCLLQTAMNVANFPDKLVLLGSLKTLLLLVGSCPVPLSALTSNIAAAHNTSSLILYYSFKPELSQVFGQLLVSNFVKFSCPVAVTLANLAVFFNDMSKARFVSGSEQFMLPVLLTKAAQQPDLVKLVHEYAEFDDNPLSTVLTRSFQYIYVHIWMNESEANFRKAMRLIEEMMNMKSNSLKSLVLHCLKSIIHQFLFNYHRDESKVENGLKEALEITSVSNVKEHIAAHLESRFVGFLLFLVSKFTKEGSALSEKLQSLESLTAVLRLMGRHHVTPVARKVLATLQTTLSLEGKEHYGLQCKAWASFVHNVDSNELAPFLSTIVVSILPMLEYAENDVINILKYLLIEQKSAMVNYLPTITFLPDHPALISIKNSIFCYTRVDTLDVKERIARETALSLHETVGVRIEGLNALLKTLTSFSMEVQSLIDGSDSPDSSVVAMWEALLECCRDPEPRISVTAAACLGELGALDPALLPRQLKPANRLPLTVHDPEFGYLALCEIVRGFQNARTSVDMDAFAIGMQELLKIYEVTAGENNCTWVRFSPLEQSLLRPMFTSYYKVQAPVRSSWPEVIFGSPDANSHLRWGAFWASKLISICTDAKAVFLFRACEPSLKRDPKVLQFFLQYIVLHILLQDWSYHDAVQQEMQAVLEWRPADARSQMTSYPVRLKETCGFPQIRSSLGEADIRDCAMTVFLIIDFLQYWSRSYLNKHAHPTADHLRKKDYVCVKDFLEKINLGKIASSNFDMQEYPRAIRCWEDIARESNEKLAENLPILSKAYARYGDLDSVAGARTMQGSTLSVEDQIFYHQVSQQIEEARILYEQLGSRGNLSASQVEGLVLCYLRLGEPSSAYSHIERHISAKPEMPIVLAETMTECLLKLSDWKSLDTLLKSDVAQSENSWYTQLSRVMLDLRTGHDEQATEKVVEARTALVEKFSGLGIRSGTDNQGYHCMVKLHILNDVERVQNLIRHSVGEDAEGAGLLQLFKHWETKESLVQSNNEFREQLLSTRRVLLSVLSDRMAEQAKSLIKVEEGKYWVKSAEVARKAGCLHQAYNYILCAEPYNIPHTFIQKVQLLWDKGQKEESLLTLTRGIELYFPKAGSMNSMQPNENFEERKMTAEAKLLFAIYNEETSNYTPYDNLQNYQEAFDVCKNLEKTQVLLAQCLDRVLSLEDAQERGAEARAAELRSMMVSHFGKSLTHGCEYIYQSVPRMLTIWLDLGENLTTEERARAMKKVNRVIQSYSERLPPFILMTALPQLLSRILHPNREVLAILKSILVKLILAFPQQCLWAMQTLAKSSVPERSGRCKEVFNDPALQSSESSMKLIRDFSLLADRLNVLTNKNLPQPKTSAQKTILVSNVVKELPEILQRQEFSQIILPITRFSSIALPKDVTSTTHQPFPKRPVTIAGIKKEMSVLPSLQKPRKITFIGSDGNSYDILCKPKDDLRRDGRLMEFNNIVNMYLHRDPDSRARHLHIKTYVVTPLGENGGLLEWVPHLVGLRPALLQLYKEHGKAMSTKELRQHGEVNLTDPLEKKLAVFLEKLIPKHPPLFFHWFRLTFPDPAGWYAARQAYTRTTAVMSMVGYILGLGDRHGENILFDSESGDTVHVDFNCLFNKGELFDWKERVPFRLTHNMASAMGPCGVEGTFRKSCEMSMRVLRAQGKTLMSVLTPFAYDPFGSWSKNKVIGRTERDQKISEALQELGDIERRLNGSMRINQKNNDFYLSVEGLVRALIKEATSTNNLCQMYLGWGAYL